MRKDKEKRTGRVRVGVIRKRSVVGKQGAEMMGMDDEVRGKMVIERGGLLKEKISKDEKR